MNKKDKAVVESYLRRSEDSLEMARAGVRMGNHYGAYHLSLTFELVVKAVRLRQGLAATREHLVYKLLEGLEPEPWPARIRALENLEVYATSYRYSTGHGNTAAPSTEEALEYIEKLSALIELARKELLD